jgi:hypothetical protein
MHRSAQLMLLTLFLLCSSLACTPKLVGPTVPSSYFFSVQRYDTMIWLLLPESPLAERLPRVATLTVRVQDTQGRPVDGATVVFAVEPAWAQSASITPPRAVTRDGMARAVLEPQTTGAVRVMVHVENLTQQVTITIGSAPAGGAPGGV